VRVSDFHFDLPEDLIAQHPPSVRGSSRMLVLNRALPIDQPGALTDDLFANLPNHLQPGDLLVLNDTRVLPARLFATRTGLTTQPNSPAPSGLIEVLLTEQIESAQPGENIWRALVKPARKVRPGETLHFHDHHSIDAVILTLNEVKGKNPLTPPAVTPQFEHRPAPPKTAPILTAEVLSTGEHGERTLCFVPTPPREPDFYARLARIGHMPLPPYIHRAPQDQDEEEDKARYQTVYSQTATPPGSAAAPTAGLHFTPEILAALQARGVEIAYLTLHVGLGTFQPVRVEELADIRLHSERYTLPTATADALNRALRDRRRIIAVGTTTTRALEHIAQQATTRGGPSFPASSERVGYRAQHDRTPSSPRPTTAGMDSTASPSIPIRLHPHSGSTSIFLAPGHRFRIVSGLLTNFHLPQSTLLMLAAAFAGAHSPEDPDQSRQTILAAYAHAIQHRYRFYSYGDCMLLL
jgi:S-adenosylmethionine:tRNA ribosyltransferase-isomerase